MQRCVLGVHFKWDFTAFFFTALLLPDKPNAQQFAWQMYAGKSQRITVRGYGTAVCFHRKY